MSLTPGSDLMRKMAVRAKELADKKLDSLRSMYPETTNTQSELIQLCKHQGLSKGKLIEAIIIEEFDYEASQLDTQTKVS